MKLTGEAVAAQVEGQEEHNTQRSDGEPQGEEGIKILAAKKFAGRTRNFSLTVDGLDDGKVLTGKEGDEAATNEKSKEDDAAKKIQAVQRGNAARKEEQEKADAATKIQAVHRGNKSRKKSKRKKKHGKHGKEKSAKKHHHKHRKEEKKKKERGKDVMNEVAGNGDLEQSKKGKEDKAGR